MTVAGDQLRTFLERIERMEEEKAAIAADIKEIYAEAKAFGYDSKILRQIVRIRKQDQNERQEQEALLDLYMAELGMLPLERYADDDAPAAERAAPLMHRAEVITSRVNVPAGFEVETGEEVTTPEITEPQSSEAAAQAGRASLPATSSPVESDPVEISTPHPVANVEEEASGEDTAVSDDAASREPDGAGRQQPADSGFTGGREPGSGEPVAAAQGRAPLYLSPDAPFHDPNDIEDEDGAQPVEPSRGSSIEGIVRRLRPRCQNPSMCGSSGGTELCRRCKKALAEAEVPA